MTKKQARTKAAHECCKKPMSQWNPQGLNSIWRYFTVITGAPSKKCRLVAPEKLMKSFLTYFPLYRKLERIWQRERGVRRSSRQWGGILQRGSPRPLPERQVRARQSQERL